jgi:nucleoside-diphosphate-sugar epimerase
MLAALQEEGFTVHALVHRSKPYGSTDHLIFGGINALDHKLIDQIQPKLIIHCARPTLPRLRRLGRFLSARYAARLNRKLLDQLKKTSCRPLLVFSSGSLVYGNSSIPHEEKLSVDPISYARQYYRGEMPYTRAVEDGSYPLLMFRLPWLLGAGSWFKWFYLDAIQSNQAVPLFSAGDNIMEIIDVRDAVRLMIYFSNQGKTGIINIPGSIRMTQRSFADQVSSAYKVPQKQYEEVFAGKLEKEAIDAFTSNILLKSLFEEEMERFDLTTLEDSLRDIRLAGTD